MKLLRKNNNAIVGRDEFSQRDKTTRLNKKMCAKAAILSKQCFANTTRNPVEVPRQFKYLFKWKRKKQVLRAKAFDSVCQQIFPDFEVALSIHVI